MVGLLCGGVSIFAQDFVIPEPALQNAIARSLGVSERSLSKSLVEKNYYGCRQTILPSAI